MTLWFYIRSIHYFIYQYTWQEQLLSKTTKMFVHPNVQQNWNPNHQVGLQFLLLYDEYCSSESIVLRNRTFSCVQPIETLSSGWIIHTFWRNWTTAFTLCSMTSIMQSSQVLFWIMKTTMKDCWRITLKTCLRERWLTTNSIHTSFWIVILILILFEWGSVQTNSASTNLTNFKPMGIKHKELKKCLSSSSNREPWVPWNLWQRQSMEDGNI